MAERRKWGQSTTALHAGYSPVPMDMTPFRSFVPPLIQSAVFPLSDVDHYTRIVKGEEPGFDYGRNSNPTSEVLHQRLAALEGGEAAMATPSGVHACFVVMHHLAGVGDDVLTSHRIFGEAYGMFYEMAPEKLGITTNLVEDPGDLDEWNDKITPRTKFLWAETPSNPTYFVMDIAGIAEVAHAHGIPLVVDNTLATPCLQQPLALGADIVVHSLTKFMAGQGAIVGGSIVASQEQIQAMGSRIARVGAIMSPMDSWLVLMGLETLPLRMERHSSNAETLVEYLAGHPKVKGINYPTAEGFPQWELASQQMPDGFGGLLSFEVEGGREGAVRVMNAFELIPIIPSFGTSRTIATHPATHTHCNMKPEERDAVGIYDGLIRVSVGLEDAEDLIADLDQALEKLNG
jgi:cystathionine beta-lyase/cystathionine gamma-synthase